MAKNRRYQREKNGRFFCWHDWKPNGKVGTDWDIAFRVFVPARCSKCGKHDHIISYMFEEWPDELISPNIRYV